MSETNIRDRLKSLIAKLRSKRGETDENTAEAKKDFVRNVAVTLRRKGLKVLALGERIRVRAARHPISPLLYLVILALVIGVVTFNGTYTRAYVLTIDGEEMGMIASEGDVDAMVSNVETRAASILGEEYNYQADIELTPAITTASELGDLNAMQDTMFDSVGALVEAYAISVDGVELGYAPAEVNLRAMLDCIAYDYSNENTTGYDFVEDVQIYPVQLPSNTEYDLASIFEQLTAHTIEEAYYTVEKGDTFNQIAYSLGMTPAELSGLNFDININQLYIGQQLVIQQAVPYLSVITYTNETYEEAIPSPVEYVETPDLYIGYTKVKTQGEDGLALVNADVVYVNGVETERTINTSETLEEPTTTYMYTGTTPRPKTASNGYYIWPTSGTITSPYGWRYLFGAREFHTGLDIANRYGTYIKAADGGKVTYSGWMGSYGKLVIITHDNGSQTYYAHNSTLLVSVGEKVYQGQAIAKMGSTGNSTGPHLHFEIRINGRTVNPQNYLY